MANESIRFFDEERKVWNCPCEGCSKGYKGLATLNTHYDRKHPRGMKPTWIYDEMTRDKSAKYEQKKQSKRVGEVQGVNYQDFKSTQFKVIKSANPSMTFGDIMKQVAKEWKARKGMKEVTQEPIPIPSTEWVAWIDDVADNLAERFMTEAIAEISEKDTCEEVVAEPFDADDETSQADIEYDADLVECCKAWRCGGFVKAYRLLNDGKYSFQSSQGKNEEGTPSRTYTVSIDGKKRKATTLADIREALEDTYVEMGNAWF